jgi:serine/threonine-protein kinase
MPFFCIHCRSEIDPTYKACPFCGEQITEFLRKHLESPIDGKYQLLARLGVGGMGEVYKVLHIHLNSVRVIKLMRSAIASDKGAHDRFLREARLATRIQHPNVAALFDFATLDEGSRYMVWEFIEGTNLHELIESRGPLSPKYAAMLAVQALRGLDAIHRAGIVHRDVSPENLMITRDDEGHERVKIIDLGIAKTGEEGDDKTKTGMFVGKWKYCSPEHLGMMEPGEKIDGRADLYSFGIVLYEMLAGVPPFQADTPHGYLLLHASEKPKPLRELNPTVPSSPELEAIIFKSLEKDRTKRFATAREFADALEKIIPSLSDQGGAQPIPVAMEATDEATMSVRANDAPTIASQRLVSTVRDSNDAPTVVTADVAMPAKKKRSRAPAIAIVLVVIVGGGAATMMRNRVSAPKPPATMTVTASSAGVLAPATPQIAQASAHVGIHAFPWAEVKRVRDLADGQDVDLPNTLVTPAQLDLTPGRYEITLSNPSFDKPITQTIEVASGDDRRINVQFTDAARAPLPNFGGTP